MDITRGLALLWRQRLVVGAVAIIGLLAFGLALMNARQYTATATILAAYSSSQDVGVLDPRRDPTASAIALNDLPNLMTSGTVLGRVGADLHLSTEETAKLPAAIKVRAPALGSDVLPVTATASDPERAVAEANSAVHELQTYEREVATSRYDLLINDLRGQLSARRNALAETDRQISALSASSPYISPASGTEALHTRLVALLGERDHTYATLLGDRAAARVLSLRPALAGDLAAEEIVKDNPVFQNLRSQYGKDLATLHNEQAGYTASFPGLTGLRNVVEREGASLAAAQAEAAANPAKSQTFVAARLDANKAQAALVADGAALDGIEGQVEALERALSSSSGAGVALASMLREREAGSQAYAQLANRLATAEADRAQAASINAVVVLDPATSADPALFSRPAILATALGVVFLWLAVTLALIADGADSRLRTRAKIEELYGGRVFTTVG